MVVVVLVIVVVDVVVVFIVVVILSAEKNNMHDVHLWLSNTKWVKWINKNIRLCSYATVSSTRFRVSTTIRFLYQIHIPCVYLKQFF